MSSVFVTGSADGLGRMAAERLVAQGHDVVLHARSEARAEEALAAVPGARSALAGDLASIEQTVALADQANAAGRFDAVIHNAAVGYREARTETVDGHEHVFAINVLAPYLLTARMTRPSRLIYLSSGMHSGGELVLDDLQWTHRRWSGAQAYSDSKLMDAMLAFAVARLWPDVSSNAVTPGCSPAPAARRRPRAISACRPPRRGRPARPGRPSSSRPRALPVPPAGALARADRRRRRGPGCAAWRARGGRRGGAAGVANRFRPGSPGGTPGWRGRP